MGMYTDYYKYSDDLFNIEKHQHLLYTKRSYTYGFFKLNKYDKIHSIIIQ